MFESRNNGQTFCLKVKINRPFGLPDRIILMGVNNVVLQNVNPLKALADQSALKRVDVFHNAGPFGWFWKKVQSISVKSDTPERESNSHAQVEYFREKLNRVNQAITLLFVATESAETISLESFVKIHRQVAQIYQAFQDMNLPGCRDSLERFKAALTALEKTIPKQRKAEEAATDCIKLFKVLQDDDQTGIQAIKQSADCLVASLKVLNGDQNIQGLVDNLTNYFLDIPCLLSHASRTTLEQIKQRNAANGLTKTDKAHVKEKLEYILARFNEAETPFKENTAICKKAIAAADSAYNTAIRQLDLVEQRISEREEAL